MRWKKRKGIASYSLDSVGIRQLLFEIEVLVYTRLSSINVAQGKENGQEIKVNDDGMEKR